jgi:hypothetical protein
MLYFYNHIPLNAVRSDNMNKEKELKNNKGKQDYE